MASWLKAKLFGRQLSYGSENEDPQSFQEALQSQAVPNVANLEDMPYEQDFQQATLSPSLTDQVQQVTLTPSLASQATPGASEMNAAYNVSNMLVRERMESEDPENIAILDSIKDSDIVCVRGTYDHIHLVLEAIGIPFAHVNPQSLVRMELKPEQTVYVNCPSSFPRDAALKLKTFVEQGGQLITTDWALKHVLEVAFPGTVRYGGKATGDEVVAVEIVDKEDNILKGFLDQEKDAAPVWWLEGSSYPIEILDKKKVKVLVRSDELKRRYHHDPVIISFEWGKGVVYHMISHFYLQRSEIRTQKQGMTSTAYAQAQGASKETMDLFDEVQTTSPQLNYGMVQSAATSSEFVSRVLVKQKKKYTPKAKSS